ncbi:MAG: arginine--tRNA ligase [Candidatus Velamenicoccus archaeovorus]
MVRLLSEAVGSARPELGLDGDPPAVELSRPKQKAFGDFSTNVALALASLTDAPARDVAAAIVRHLPEDAMVERAEVAGPGFINLFVKADWLYDTLREAVAAGPRYGWAPPSGRSVNVEFVSANPTGPLHIGHARNAVIGDAIANVLEARGWRVEREYYFNDAGGQMDRFGASVEARYLQLVGRDAEVPEDGYHGEYLLDVARDIRAAFGDALADLPEVERFERLRHEGAERVLGLIRPSLERLGVRFDVFFSEQTLHRSGLIDEAVRRLREAGYAYDHEGAVFFRSTAFGDDKDRVIVRRTGAPTYFGADCAYLLDKFGRGFDHLIYVWGADHHGDVARVKGAAQALGFDPGAVEIVLYQWVALTRGGRAVGMSKRAGRFVSLDELLDEVGADATRFTLLSRSNDVTIDFDIDLVKQRSMENPVYYVQYGHARIASILRHAEARGVAMAPIGEVDLTLLSTEAEHDLLRSVAEMPEQVAQAAELRAPHRLTHYAQGLATRFHRFYTDCRVVTDDEPLTQARLWLCRATKQTIANVLTLIGISAPESMERADA